MTHPLLAAYPVALSIPVQWGELDAYGHINNTIFFRWFESARIEYLQRSGMVETMERDQIGAILHSTSCRFRRPVFFPDTVEIGGRASEVGDDRFMMEYLVVSREQDAVVGEGTGIIVSYDYAAHSKAPLPDDVRRRIAALEEAVGDTSA
jgi:acyl-CoA thioester hydrolase